MHIFNRELPLKRMEILYQAVNIWFRQQSGNQQSGKQASKCFLFFFQ